MGNSASTEQQTKPTNSSTAATATEKTDQQLHFSISNSDLKRYSDELSTEQGHRQKQEQQQQRQNDPTAPSIGHSPTPFQLSITEPITTTTTTTNTMTNPNTTTGSGWTSSTSNTVPIDTTSSPKPVPGKSGWVSSTGASSPWYGGGSLSSSASSTHHPQPSSASTSYQQQQQQRSHRQSISGPYYRARGLSVNQQQEPTEEDLISPSSSTSVHQPHPPPQPQQPSPSVSTAQPPRLQLQQLQLNSSSPASPVSYTKSDAFPKEKTPTDSGIPTIITWTQGGDNVYVTGTFNGWKHKIKLVKSTHDFNTVVDLPLGTHRLKFIVDDEWKCSNDMETATDPDGNLVNYLQVMDEDDMDDELGQDASGDKTSTEEEEEEYSSVIPKELLLLSEAMQQKDTGSDGTTDGNSMDPQQKRNILEWERKQPQPPSLPPHLEKVLLNSHTVSNEDNSVLPVPHHVTLNHLYACSIKDHVMALSSTTRYRKKYVTTMYYRPV